MLLSQETVSVHTNPYLVPITSRPHSYKVSFASVKSMFLNEIQHSCGQGDEMWSSEGSTLKHALHKLKANLLNKHPHFI